MPLSAAVFTVIAVQDLPHDGNHEKYEKLQLIRDKALLNVLPPQGNYVLRDKF
jgi:hypothetical protein